LGGQRDISAIFERGTPRLALRQFFSHIYGRKVNDLPWRT
jgi:hypothetical protein